MTHHCGRTVAAAKGGLRDKQGKLYAHATCMIFPVRARGRSIESAIR
jgi:acyl-coenzyme A thioesterase PaaI-like protein